MLNKKVEEALNAQINAEFWSAYLYLSMSAYFEAEDGYGLYQLDKELAARVYNIPAPLANTGN